jgi:hypothetical protein
LIERLPNTAMPDPSVGCTVVPDSTPSPGGFRPIAIATVVLEAKLPNPSFA